LVGTAGAVLTAILGQANTWSLVFGGITAADLIAVLYWKPLRAIEVVVTSTIKLDLLQLRYAQQLAECATRKKLKDRFECNKEAWESVRADLNAML
jgi:hypothetical protein